MKAFTIVIGIILVLIVSLLIFAGWLGVFSNVTINERIDGGYIIAGQQFVGDYAKVGQQMPAIEKKLKSAGINCSRGFGIYYDNPDETPREKCRSFIGDIIEEKDYSFIENLKKLSLKVDTIYKKKSLIIVFPYKNMMSFFVGPMKAYPVLNKYISEKNYKPTLVWEMYDLPNKKLCYIMQL